LWVWAVVRGSWFACFVELCALWCFAFIARMCLFKTQGTAQRLRTVLALLQLNGCKEGHAIEHVLDKLGL
jgi:hypothetical protein